MKKTIATVVIVMMLILPKMSNSHSDEEKTFFKNDFIVINKSERLKLQTSDSPEEAVFYVQNSRCKVEPIITIDFYDKNSVYKNVDDFLKIHTEKALFVSKVVGNITKKKTNDGRELYYFARKSVKILKPRTLNSEEIPTLEYYILVTAKDNEGFYQIFYEVCEDEKTSANQLIEELLKSIKFIK